MQFQVQFHDWNRYITPAPIYHFPPNIPQHSPLSKLIVGWCLCLLCLPVHEGAGDVLDTIRTVEHVYLHLNQCTSQTYWTLISSLG